MDKKMQEFHTQLSEDSNGNVLLEALRALTKSSSDEVSESPRLLYMQWGGWT